MNITRGIASQTKMSKIEMKRFFAEVSVIIPCYCCSETIRRTLASIAAQTLLPKEVILVEDSSPDEGATLNILHEEAGTYADYFDIVVVALIENKGAANARNVGWDLASQPYIALLDADDAWHSEKIEIQYNFMKNNPDIYLSGHEKRIVSEDVGLDWQLTTFHYKLLSPKKMLLSNPFVTPSVMFKRNNEYKFNPIKRYVDDHLLWLEIVFDNHKVAKLSQQLVAIYKPMFGATGLSSHMWKMEKAELDNYWLLFKEKKIRYIVLVLIGLYSFAKYIRRLLIVGARRAFTNCHIMFLK